MYLLHVIKCNYMYANFGNVCIINVIYTKCHSLARCSLITLIHFNRSAQWVGQKSLIVLIMSVEPNSHFIKTPTAIKTEYF